MKMNQEMLEYKPISIVLETVEEANAMREIVEDQPNSYSHEAKQLMVDISNLYFDCTVEVPNVK